MSQYDLLHRLQLFRDRGQPPGLETHGGVRPGGRTSPLTEAETSRVRRALFGPVDHAENLRFVQQELARGQKEAERRWNYDFVNDRPVNDPDRRYLWESMDPCSRNYTRQIASNADTEENIATVQPASSNKDIENIPESVHSESENIKTTIEPSTKSKSQDTMSEKILSKPNPIIMPPQPKNKSNHPSSLEMANSSISISAPATACATPHESPQAGSTKSGSQIIPTSKSERGSEICDKTKTTPAGSILSAVAVSLSSSKPSKTSTSDQRSRSTSLHGTQKPISGLFRERKRSKSKTKIDTRSIKLQELQAPSQMSVVSGDGRTAPTSRSRSPNSKYTESQGN